MTRAHFHVSAAARAAAVLLLVSLAVSATRARAADDELPSDPGIRAGRFEAMARDHQARGEAEPAASDFQRAARYWYLAGERDRAASSSDRALELARRDERVSYLLTWRLYFDHGLINEKGDAALVRRWPGDEFTDAVYATVRRLEGNSNLGRRLLMFASQAVAGGRPAIALDLYLLAWNNPDLMDEARRDDSVWRALLMALPMAIDLKRFEDAERILARAGSFSGISREEMDAYRTAVAEARHDAAREADRSRRAARERDAETGTPTKDAAPPGHRGLLGRDAEDEEKTGPPAEGERSSGREPDKKTWNTETLLLVLAAVAVVAFVVVLIRRR